MQSLIPYYRLTKPGIVYGNSFAAIAGYFVGGTIEPAGFYLMLFGIAAVVAGGCVFNNYIDRDIDAKMERTKKRALVTGTIPEKNALMFASFLAVSGIVSLYAVNPLSALIGAFGLFVYVVVYSLWSKRQTLHATLIGAVAGAVPPVVGYTASAGSLDIAAFVLFLILVTWQMPHALAIAIRRYRDYETASIPIMPIVRSIRAAKVQMTVYVAVFMLAVVALPFTGVIGHLFGMIMGVLSAGWLVYSIYGFWDEHDESWAKNMFLLSIVANLALCVLCVLFGFFGL